MIDPNGDENNDSEMKRSFMEEIIEWFLIILVVASLLGFSLKIMF